MVVATKSGLVPVNAAKQSSPRAATSINTARHVNTAALKPKANAASPTKYSYFKAHSPLRRPFNQKSVAKTNNFNKKVYTAKVNNITTAGPKAVVSTAVGNRENVGNLQYALQDQEIFDNGCSRNMTGNKSYLIDYQDIDGGFVAFAGSPKGGKITGKIKIRTGKLDFEDIECLVLSPDFKLLDESQVLLKVPRQNNMYNFDRKNVVPSGGLTGLFTKAIIDESNLWYMRLGHINFKTMNQFVRGNLVRGLPSKLFENDHTCVACQKGKQHKASSKTKLVSTISHPLQMLHMDLFRPTFVRSINHKIYCLVVIDDYSRFSWVFFLATKDETSRILKTFITGIENQINHKVKIIRCDNGTDFKNNDMNQFCGIKGIKREFSVARTPQQNGVVERKSRCPCTNLNDLKIPYAIFDGRLMRGLGSGPEWLFDIDSLTKSMNYEPVTAGNQTNGDAGIETNVNAGQARQEKASDHEYILLPLMLSNSPLSSKKEGRTSNKEYDQHVQDFRAELDSLLVQQKEGYANSTNRDSTTSPSVSTIRPSINTASENINTGSPNINIASPIPNDSSMQSLENIGIFDDAYDDREVGAEADLNNLETTINVRPIPITRIHKDHPKDQIIRDINSATQTRRMTKISKEHAMVSYIKKQRKTNHKDYQNFLFAYFLSQIEPKKVIQALTDPNWIEAMQEELLQFKLQKV
ncbi:putative ribonuclease H-like domain-containing protein [Tanacetum coccineum]